MSMFTPYTPPGASGSGWTRSAAYVPPRAQPAAQAGTADQQSANAIVQQFLNDAGLGDLSNWAWQQIVSGASPAQIEVELYQQPEFKQAFPEYDALRAAGLPTDLTPADLLHTRAAYRQAMQAEGHDTSQLTAKDYLPLMLQQISPAEFTQRLTDYRTVQQVYGPHLRAGFEQHAGIGNLSDADMYGLLSGLKPELAQQYAAKTGTPNTQFGFADIKQAMAKAEAEDQAMFKAGGTVTVGPTSATAEETNLTRRASTFA